MIRLYIVVEGNTEETFASQVLCPHLQHHRVSLRARRIGKPGHKGGRVNYSRAKGDVLLLLKEDSRAYCTTLFDFYGLGEGFPRLAVPPSANSEQKAQSIEKPFQAAIEREMGDGFLSKRFVPYLQMHEFEGLLFSDPSGLAAAMGRPDLRQGLEAIRSGFATPEEINDGPTTAPSKRIRSLAPAYDKVFNGNLAALEIGLAKIRQECPRFDAWVRGLESLT